MATAAPRKISEIPFTRRRRNSNQERALALAKLHLYIQHSIRAPETLYLICLNRLGQEVCVAWTATTAESTLVPIDNGLAPADLDESIDFLYVAPGVVTAQWKRGVESFSGSHGIADTKRYPMIDSAVLLASVAPEFDHLVREYYIREIDAEIRRSGEVLNRFNNIFDLYKGKERDIRGFISATVAASVESQQVASKQDWSLERSKDLAKLNNDISRAIAGMRAITEELLQAITEQ